MTKWIFNGVEFNVGDKVKVLRKIERRDPDGMGNGKEWKNGWTGGMNIHIGSVQEIDGISDCGASFVGVTYGWPLAALEKLTVALPEGMFKLIDKTGVVYEVSENRPLGYLAKYPSVIRGATARAALDKQQIVENIENGFWWIDRSDDLIKKEAKLEKLEERRNNLINEINKLEEEIAQW